MSDAEPARISDGDETATALGYRLIETSNLLLDPQNPRLLIEGETEQAEILRRLYESESLSDLAYSIAASGFFAEEPLVVISEGAPEGKYYVVEGNRRLATILILTDPALRAELQPGGWPELDTQKRESLTRLPCVLRSSREEVEAFLVFRHITGIKKWDYFQKARYVTGLIEGGLSIDEIEQRIGDDVGTIKKLYQAFLVYRHIRDDLSIDTGPLLQTFSLLEVALGQRPIKRYIGLPHPLPSERRDRIVPEESLDHLRELVTWIFGDSNAGLSRVIRDSRDINEKLSPVIANPRSLEYLRETRDLDEAYQRSSDDLEYLNKQLYAAERALRRALGQAPSFRGNSGVGQKVGELAGLVEAIRELIA